MYRVQLATNLLKALNVTLRNFCCFTSHEVIFSEENCWKQLPTCTIFVYVLEIEDGGRTGSPWNLRHSKFSNTTTALPNIIVHITKSIGVNLYHKANISVGLKPELKRYCAISTTIRSVFWSTSQLLLQFFIGYAATSIHICIPLRICLNNTIYSNPLSPNCWVAG